MPKVEKWVVRLFDENTNELVGEKFVPGRDRTFDVLENMKKLQPPTRSVFGWIAPMGEFYE